MTSARYEVLLTQGAEDDLEGLYDYVAAHRSPAEATALLDALLERIGALEAFPHRGAAPTELAALGMTDFRQIVLPPYRLIYRVLDATVAVVVIADGRRDMQALLERRLLDH